MEGHCRGGGLRGTATGGGRGTAGGMEGHCRGESNKSGRVDILAIGGHFSNFRDIVERDVGEGH